MDDAAQEARTPGAAGTPDAVPEDTTAAPAGSAGAEAPPADARERFREALERKKAQAHRSAEGVARGSTVHGPETTGPGRRRFQRKSG
ncbi:DUF5302 domain-containing protein [Cellulomonas endophytica]|uniref:DUF5302 domain-containing protein n=1 Tax=Cellulomonas endophytica TaxID=2494735 RepID=UPI001011331E|nr:DUF5302 domain-containing protein [Cellulomonas endophytica]